MEREKCFLLIILSIALLPSFGQSNTTIYRAYISGNMEMWKSAVDSIERMKGKSSQEKLELLNYQYGCIAYYVDNNKEEARRYLQQAQGYIKQLEQNRYNLSMLYAYKSAFVGFEIGISPYKAPFIGPESISHAEKSVSMDPENAFGYVQLGNIAYYMPEIFGGSKSEAIAHYLKALMLMEKTPLQLINNWNYVNLLVTIINTYFELEQYELAKNYCIKALHFESDFDWVRDRLYPKVLKKLNNE